MNFVAIIGTCLPHEDIAGKEGEIFTLLSSKKSYRSRIDIESI